MDLNKWVLSSVLNESSVVEARMWTGRLFGHDRSISEKVIFDGRKCSCFVPKDSVDMVECQSCSQSFECAWM